MTMKPISVFFSCTITTQWSHYLVFFSIPRSWSQCLSLSQPCLMTIVALSLLPLVSISPSLDLTLAWSPYYQAKVTTISLLLPFSNLLALGFTGWRTLHSNSCSQSQSRPRFHSRCTTDILGLPLHIKIDLRHDISANISDLYLEPLDQDLKFKVRTIGSFWFFLFCLCFKPLDLLDYF